MAGPDLDGGYDPQDTAEAFDETHNVDEMTASDETRSFEPDLFEDVFDATAADGDADEDEFDPDELSLEDAEDDQGVLYLDEDIDEDLAQDQQRLHPGPVPTAAGEADVQYVNDIDNADGGGRPHDRLSRRYESTGELSDSDLSELGYSNKEASTAMQTHPKPTDDEKPVKGSGASAEDVPEENDADEESRLDEGLEETFPASDPVSAKHIT